MIKLIDKVVSLGHTEDMSLRIIKSGQVMVNNEVLFMPNQKINDSDSIIIKESKKYVSRGAFKLLNAIEEFDMDLNNKVVLDIGSSTGGFTQVSLESGAKHVFALDVGTNQLEYKLRNDKRVTTLEKTNLKTITKEMFNESIDVVVTDVSFISLKHVFKVVNGLDTKVIMALIKPQYEANSNQILKGGIAPKEIHEEIIEKVKSYASEYGFVLSSIKESPITGAKSKNIEYISIFNKK
ncbi:MAG: TlyA family RNA methyltransferase [Mycoplasmataceae bacterium]|nr:TlyA family RNA methyltransferase [Mycoplasmataceae bacterium]